MGQGSLPILSPNHFRVPMPSAGSLFQNQHLYGATLRKPWLKSAPRSAASGLGEGMHGNAP